MTSRCFIIEKSRQDTRSAEKFGTPVIVFEERNGRSSMWSPEFRTELRDAFHAAKFDPRKDFLVVVGHQILLMIAVGELLTEYGALRLLCYYTPEQAYTEVNIGTEIFEGQSHASGSQETVQ